MANRLSNLVNFVATGRLGDIFGRRWYLMAGNVISLIGAIICATGHSIPALIGGGSLIGIAASMRQMAWACMGELVPKRSRGVAFAFLQQTLSLAQAFGPIMGEFLRRHVLCGCGALIRCSFWLHWQRFLEACLLVTLRP